MPGGKGQEFRGGFGQKQSTQVGAEAATDGCLMGHWRLDGTTPGTRYTLAGGNQVNAERITGLNSLRVGKGSLRVSGCQQDSREAVSLNRRKFKPDHLWSDK